MNNTKPNPPQDWHPADVVAALHKRGLSLRQLALTNGYNSRSLSQTLRAPMAQGEVIISGALGVTPQTLWPSRYDGQGQRLDRRSSQRCPACGYIHSKSAARSVNVNQMNTTGGHHEKSVRNAA